MSTEKLRLRARVVDATLASVAMTASAGAEVWMWARERAERGRARRGHSPERP